MRGKFNKKSAVLIVQERLRSIDIAFDDVSEIKYVPPNELIAFRDYVRATKKYVGDNYIYAHYAFNDRKRIIYTGRINFLDRYKSDICELPLDTPYHIPYVKDISDEAKARLCNEYKIDKARTIILAPHSNTYRVNVEFWQKLVECLTRKGFVVYTNGGVKNNGEAELPLDNTLPLHVSLNEIYWLADKVRCIIGMRSGLFDLLIFSKGMFFCVSNTTHNDLKQMFPNSDSIFRTLYLMPNYPPEKIKRWNLRAENFFDTADDMLEELIKSIEGL